MAGRKRAADTDSPPATRSAKVAKTSGATTKGKKGGAKAKLSTTAFKSRALPLHVHVTHTPPAVTEDDSTVPAHTADPGFIGALTLLPGSMSTGSYGWKGSKRLTVEIDNPEGGDKEKIQVQLTFNATVIGSKSAKGDDEEEEEKDVHEEHENEAEADVEKAVEPEEAKADEEDA